jgi:hypothetical protein
VRDHVGMRFAHRARWVASVLVVVACVVNGLPDASAMTKKGGTKRATTRRPATKRPAATTAAPTTAAPKTIAPSTAPPTTSPPTTAPPTTSPAPVTFERSVYSVTVASGGSVTLPLWLNIPKNFTGTLTLRPVGLNAETRIAFDPNPVRNFVVATIANVAGTGALPTFQIEAVSTANPTQVLAQTIVAVFVVGGTPTGTAGTFPLGTTPPAGGSGIVYSFPAPASPLVRGGQVITVPISITRQGGSSAAVTMVRVSALPGGMSSSFKFGTTLGDIDYLFVGADTTTAPGNYTITVEAVSTFGRIQLTIPVMVA